MAENTRVTGKSAKRGRETLFRVTFRNQINLTQIADNKSNMIISISFIIISLIITIFASGNILSGESFLSSDLVKLPVAMIILTCTISASLAIQAARPYLIKGKNEKVNPAHKTSLLFFANYHKKSLNEYIGEMEQLLNSGATIYETMIIDIYNQGKVLHRKYKFLSIAYMVFMYGFIISVGIFLISYLVI